MKTKHSYTEQVAAEVRAAIARKGMHNFQIASATEIPNSTLSRKLAGKSPFSVGELGAIAAHLELSIRELAPEINYEP